jgi:dephospho-CoA kinase
MMSIGVGGQIGTGKTYVAKELIKLFQKDKIKAQLVDADQIAWELYTPNTQIYHKIIRAFGQDILTQNKEINRKKLAQIVFENKTNIQQLNKIAHPALLKNIKAQLQSKDKSVKILDAALLFLWGKKIPVDWRILVIAPLNQKIARMKKRGYNPKEVKKRIKQQMQESEMEKSADFVINNNSAITKLKKRVTELYKILKEINNV